MADPARHLHFNVNDDEIVHDNQGNDNQDDPISEAQAGQVVQLGLRRRSLSRWNNPRCLNSKDRRIRITSLQSFSSGGSMTWPEATTGMTQPPTPMWQTLSGVLPATGCSPQSRCSTGLEIKRSTYVDNLILNLHLKPRFQ
jgi:hypothetical protein